MQFLHTRLCNLSISQLTLIFTCFKKPVCCTVLVFLPSNRDQITIKSLQIVFIHFATRTQDGLTASGGRQVGSRSEVGEDGRLGVQANDPKSQTGQRTFQNPLKEETTDTSHLNLKSTIDEPMVSLKRCFAVRFLPERTVLTSNLTGGIFLQVLELCSSSYPTSVH